MSKRYTLLLYFVSALFFSLFIMLCYYSRLATDDYYFISDVRKNGIITGVISQYMEWCGRYAATFLMDLIYWLNDVDQDLYFFFPLTSGFLLVTGLFSLLNAISFQLQLNLSFQSKLIASFFFTILLFFLSIDIGETWMWYCSLSSYLWSVIAFVWGCAFLFGRYHRFISILFASICFLYVGGSSEVYSVIYGVLILLLLIFRYKQAVDFTTFLRDSLNRKILIIYLIFGLAFFVFLIAPGNYLRDQLFPEHHLGNALFITAKSIVKFSVLYLPFRLVYILAFAVPFILIGKQAAKSDTDPEISFRKFFKYSTLLFLGSALLFFLLVGYVMVETGPPRLWFVLSFLFTSYIVALSFYAGYCNIILEKSLQILKTGGMILTLMILGYNFIHQSVICRHYAIAHDGRIHHIQELNQSIQTDTLIYLNPLPSSGMLYSSEIQSDTNHFTNRELRLGYDLKFHVISGKIN